MVEPVTAPVRLARGPLKRVGGAVILDFVNTADWHLRPEPEEWLQSYADLLAWAKGVGALDAARARRLAALAKADPAAAERVLATARRLREALFRIFLTTTRGATPEEADLRLVNTWLARVAQRRGLQRAGHRLSWCPPRPDTPESVLAPILWSAGDVLTGESQGRVKLCAADGCGWVFLDASRKTNRLWCSMEGCGNRAKARRHYRRTQAAPR